MTIWKKIISTNNNVPDIWLCVNSVRDGLHLVYHGVVIGEVPGHLPCEQVQAGQHLHVEHQGGDDQHLDPGCVRCLRRLRYFYPEPIPQRGACVARHACFGAWPDVVADRIGDGVCHLSASTFFAIFS